MTAPPYDLVIGLDRSDKKADLCLIHVTTGQRRAVVPHFCRMNAAFHTVCWLRAAHPCRAVLFPQR